MAASHEDRGTGYISAQQQSATDDARRRPLMLQLHGVLSDCGKLNLLNQQPTYTSRTLSFHR
jgi:hypothetical protein